MRLFFHQLIFRPAFCTFLLLSFLIYFTKCFKQRSYPKTFYSGSVKIIKIPKKFHNRWKQVIQIKNYSPIILYSSKNIFKYGGTYQVKGQIKFSEPQTLNLSASPQMLYSPSIWHVWATKIHYTFINFTEKHLNKQSQSFLQALIFNIRDSIQPEFFDALCRTNLIHIFSISGMHVMILWKLLEFLSQKLPLPKIYRAIVTIILLYLYVITTGFQIPAFRAWIMALFVILSQITRYEADSLNFLGVAGCFILFFQPYALGELSFQLSFLCCLGLILFQSSSNIIMCSSFNQKLLHFIKNTCHSTIVANLFSLPLIAFKFHIISLLGWIINILLIPIIPFVIYLGIFSWILSYINLFLACCITHFILDPLIQLIIKIIYFFSNLRGNSIFVPSFAPFWIGVIYILIISLWRPRRKQVKIL